MARPGGRLPAGEIRPPAGQVRTSCGFCESTYGQPPGTCRDDDHHCRGTWPGFVKATEDNDTGSWTCACSAAGHPGRKEQTEVSRPLQTSPCRVSGESATDSPGRRDKSGQAITQM